MINLRTPVCLLLMSKPDTGGGIPRRSIIIMFANKVTFDCRLHITCVAVIHTYTDLDTRIPMINAALIEDERNSFQVANLQQTQYTVCISIFTCLLRS